MSSGKVSEKAEKVDVDSAKAPEGLILTTPVNAVKVFVASTKEPCKKLDKFASKVVPVEGRAHAGDD